MCVGNYQSAFLTVCMSIVFGWLCASVIEYKVMERKQVLANFKKNHNLKSGVELPTSPLVPTLVKIRADY